MRNTHTRGRQQAKGERRGELTYIHVILNGAYASYTTCYGHPSPSLKEVSRWREKEREERREEREERKKEREKERDGGDCVAVVVLVVPRLL